jgi:N-acetylmuramoyl-L-alanine amidase
MNIVRHNIFYRLFAIFLTTVPCIAHLTGIRAQDNPGVKKVVIDPGHGGRDPGAVGVKSKEKDIVLDISLRAGKLIKSKYPDVEVVYTRSTDKFIELDKRGEIANKAKADLFISVHANANKKKTPYGAETFVMGNSKSTENMEVAKRENAVILIEDDYSERYEGFDPNSPESYIYFSLLQNAYLNQSLSFAGEVQEQFKNTAKRADRGVKQANFLVLWKTTMPSVLVEVGFISNAEEEKYMMSNAGKEQLAACIYNAFCSYKTTIEERNAQPVSGTKEEQSESPAAVPKKIETAAAEEKKNVTPEKQIIFCIQISTSSKPVDTDPKNFKKYKNVERIQTSSNFYKYIVGRTTDYPSAQESLKKIRVDFKDAFIVAIVDGKITTVAEALKLVQ